VAQSRPEFIEGANGSVLNFYWSHPVRREQLAPERSRREPCTGFTQLREESFSMQRFVEILPNLYKIFGSCSGECDCENIRLIMERLILFDIDGTLTRTQNGYIPFNEAILQAFGIDGDIRTVVPDGNTDPMIVEDIFAKANVTIEFQESVWEKFTIHLCERYHHHVQQGTTIIRALPGAAELLKALWLYENFRSSVVTGNFEVTAAIKVEAAGLAPYLRRGAYASDSRHRPDLPAIAKKRWEDLTGRRLSDGQCVVIGDTPKDL
jgi:phosphoglycolate phosphatase-like HAD superfamily hydrolase